MIMLESAEIDALKRLKAEVDAAEPYSDAWNEARLNFRYALEKMAPQLIEMAERAEDK